MQTVDAEVDNGAFAGFDDFFFDEFTHFCHHFFNTRGVYTSVGHELMESQAGYLATHGVEA